MLRTFFAPIRTVSTRKRRILHVVADSWEPNGGEFLLFLPSRVRAEHAALAATPRIFSLSRPPLPLPLPLRRWSPTADTVSTIVGHFEQRISFGYDALLAQVRAEFDGEHLQVIVPRRMIPMTYHPARE